MKNKPQGRPKKILATIGSSFLNCYFDPLFSQQYICQKFGISKKTFYRYEKELARPKLRVGLGSYSELPKNQIVKSFGGGPFHYEFDLLRLICMQLQVRVKLSFGGPEEIALKTSNGDFDFSLASISYTPSRAKNLTFSYAYNSCVSPGGILYKLPSRQKSLDSERPILGVVRHGVHSVFANKELQNRFNIINFKSMNLLAQKSKKKVDYVLVHPFDKFNPLHQKHNLMKASSYFSYNSYTGVIFPSSNNYWENEVNKALEYIFTKKLITESDYFDC